MKKIMFSFFLFTVNSVYAQDVSYHFPQFDGSYAINSVDCRDSLYNPVVASESLIHDMNQVERIKISSFGNDKLKVTDLTVYQNFDYEKNYGFNGVGYLIDNNKVKITQVDLSNFSLELKNENKNWKCNFSLAKL